MSAPAGSAPILSVERVSMRFGYVVALDDVSFEARPGTVTCLLGDNGAGKSTLIRILSGVCRPTAGTVSVHGRTVTFDSPRDALDHGIATVHQDLALIPLMSVWRNFFLGEEITKGRGLLRRIDANQCRDTARTRLAGLGIDLRDPDQPVGTLSGGERQCVAIARAIHFGARVLILDEPTAALGVRQAGVVLNFIERARDRGVAIIFVTHNPHHAYAVGDLFTILRHGRVTGTFPRTDTDATHLAGLMSGTGADSDRPA